MVGTSATISRRRTARCGGRRVPLLAGFRGLGHVDVMIGCRRPLDLAT